MPQFILYLLAPLITGLLAARLIRWYDSKFTAPHTAHTSSSAADEYSI